LAGTMPRKEEEDVNVQRRGNAKASEATGSIVGGQSEAEAGRFEQVARRERATPASRIKIRDKGGITFTIN